MTSPAPETPLKRTVYRSNSWLMRTAFKPTNHCSTTALSRFRLLHIPLDGLHTHSADGGDDVVIILAVGAADQRGRHTGDGTDALIAGGDVRRDLLCRQAVVVVVVVGVTHHLVPCIMQRLHRLRVLSAQSPTTKNVVLTWYFSRMSMRVWVSSLPHGDVKVRQFTENCRTSLLCFYDSINVSYLQQNLVQKSERFLIAGYGKKR